MILQDDTAQCMIEYVMIATGVPIQPVAGLAAKCSFTLALKVLSIL